MTVLLADFHKTVMRLLASMPHLPAESLNALRSGDVDASTPVALRILQHVVTPVQLVIDLNYPEGHS